MRYTDDLARAEACGPNCTGCGSPVGRCILGIARGAIKCCPDCRHPDPDAIAAARAVTTYYFEAPDGDDVQTLWLCNHAAPHLPIAILRVDDLPAQARHLWPAIVTVVTRETP